MQQTRRPDFADPRLRLVYAVTRTTNKKIFYYRCLGSDKNPSVVHPADPLIVMRGRNSIRD